MVGQASTLFLCYFRTDIKWLKKEFSNLTTGEEVDRDKRLNPKEKQFLKDFLDHLHLVSSVPSEGDKKFVAKEYFDGTYIVAIHKIFKVMIFNFEFQKIENCNICISLVVILLQWILMSQVINHGNIFTYSGTPINKYMDRLNSGHVRCNPDFLICPTEVDSSVHYSTLRIVIM